MTQVQDVSEMKMKSGEELEKLIDKAIKKVHAKKENDLCKYLPGPKGGYIHHFTMRKLKHSNPAQLFSLLQDFIINSNSPKALEPKPRAPRGSRKKRDLFNFSRSDIERVLELARKAGDRDLLAKLSPRRSMPTLKRELIRSIRANQANEELWIAYKENLSALQAAESAI